MFKACSTDTRLRQEVLMFFGIVGSFGTKLLMHPLGKRHLQLNHTILAKLPPTQLTRPDPLLWDDLQEEMPSCQLPERDVAGSQTITSQQPSAETQHSTNSIKKITTK